MESASGSRPSLSRAPVLALNAFSASGSVRSVSSGDVIGGDLVEVSPPYDPSGNTALLGANLLYEMVCVLPGVLQR